MPTSSFTSVTLYQFNALSYERQLMDVFATGTFLANRWEEEDGVSLYYLPGNFFVELFYDPHLNALIRLRSFSISGPLENYITGVKLPDL